MINRRCGCGDMVQSLSYILHWVVASAWKGAFSPCRTINALAMRHVVLSLDDLLMKETIQSFFETPRKKPMRGPYCAAKTPMPLRS
jgi:hypothetical protein